MHPILKSQLARCRSDDGTVDLDRLLDLVQATYAQTERERARSERATHLMIEEMEALEVERRSVLETLRKEHLKLDVALDNMGRGLAMFDQDRTLVVCNKDYMRLLGRDDLGVGSSFSEDVGRLDRLIQSVDLPLADAERQVATGRSVECTARLRDGRVLMLGFQPVNGGGWVLVVRDITRQTQSDDRIRYLATHDALTGLVNRTVFNEAVETALTDRGGNRSTDVLLIDLDRFKNVNDTLGHPVGDGLLRQVARRIRDAVPSDAVVARLGGDEFAVLVTPSAGPSARQALADRLVANLSAPYAVDGHNIVIGASIGHAASPGDGETAHLLVRNADLALYRAKSAGRGTARRFEPGMEDRILARRDMELGLRFALDRGEFRLLYQPQIDLRTGRVAALEALIRWNHPTRGQLLPEEFIGLAEEIGLLVEIGEWAILQACTDALAWPADIIVAVNVSATQFRTDRLFGVVSGVLGRTGLAARRLELEITETTLISDADQAFELLHDLNMLGVRVAMDDFGTGYGSLSHLRRFPFSKIKVDQSFISELDRDDGMSAIVRTVIDLGHSLGMVVTAEGIETDTHLHLVRQLSCDLGQGFHIARPMPQPEVIGWLGQVAGATPASASASGTQG